MSDYKKNVRLVVHPGMPKCGSSSIQTSLINNRVTLTTKNIFILDKNLSIRIDSTVDEPHGIPYSIVFDVIKGKLDLEHVIQKTCDFIHDEFRTECFDLVFSSELLSFINEVDGNLFHKKLASLFDEVIVILVVRSPWEQMMSNWRQGVYREGYGFVEYSNKLMKQHSPLFSYWGSRIKAFKEIYHNVELLSLDLSDDLINDFFQCFTYFEVKATRNKSNPSLSPIFCEAMSNFSDSFHGELNDTGNMLKRHKLELMRINGPQNNIPSFFNNLFLEEHVEQLILLKNTFIDDYMSLLLDFGRYSKINLDLYNSKVRSEGFLDKYELVNRNDVHKHLSLMLNEIVTNLK